ncbi:unnamed protein product [Acanthosepion pharaonis]|uniref:Uncharacterized protein n=1 Tax=Acanthosepion pharaonis TaxID=158019 RepID=A0A812B3R5_ACAPH|nr:unnamed protein product [Sepia pharaonis]
MWATRPGPQRFILGEYAIYAAMQHVYFHPPLSLSLSLSLSFCLSLSVTLSFSKTSTQRWSFNSAVDIVLAKQKSIINQYTISRLSVCTLSLSLTMFVPPPTVRLRQRSPDLSSIRYNLCYCAYPLSIYIIVDRIERAIKIRILPPTLSYIHSFFHHFASHFFPSIITFHFLRDFFFFLFTKHLFLFIFFLRPFLSFFIPWLVFQIIFFLFFSLCFHSFIFHFSFSSFCLCLTLFIFLSHSFFVFFFKVFYYCVNFAP